MKTIYELKKMTVEINEKEFKCTLPIENWTVLISKQMSSCAASINVFHHVLKFSAHYLATRTDENIKETIRHELAHLYCYQNGIPHRDGRKEFKEFCHERNIELKYAAMEIDYEWKIKDLRIGHFHYGKIENMSDFRLKSWITRNRLDTCKLPDGHTLIQSSSQPTFKFEVWKREEQIKEMKKYEMVESETGNGWVRKEN